MAKQSRPVWFCARESGLSYYPVTWQGYAVTIGYIVLLSASSLAIFRSWALFFSLVIGLSVLLLVVVSRTKGDDF